MTRLNLDALRQEAQVDPAALQAALEAIHAALARIETALRTPGEATSAA
ncbi:hypothetical protein [Candidatus Amarolinea dominans]|nr:hypothetical protein [Anaerolineae bacterium]